MNTKNYHLLSEHSPEEIPNILVDVPEGESILVQVFSGKSEYDFLKKVQEQIKRILPTATILGCTTSGEILGDDIFEHTTVISVTAFQETILKSTFIPLSSDAESASAGEKMVADIVSPQTKAVIAFGTGITVNGEQFLQGVHKASPETVISGGLAGDNFEFQETSIFTEDTFSTSGIIAVALENESLHVHTSFRFNWQNIGKKMVITKSDGGRIYEIDGVPATEIYKKYLGTHADVLALGMDFPLIMWRSGVRIARAVLAVYDDGSLGLAGSVHSGEQVQFGFGNTTTILGDAWRTHDELGMHPVESIFVYSCCARCSFLGKSIVQESQPLSCLSPTSGFFTYGEFFHSEGENIFFNDTMTILTLSEGKALPITQKKNVSLQTAKLQRETIGINGLTHLASVVTNELTQLNSTLEERVQDQTHQLRESYEKIRNFDREKNDFLSLSSHEMRTPLSVIHGYVNILLSEKIGTLNAKQHETLEKILQNTDRLTTMTNDMLHLTEMESGQEIFQKNTIPIAPFLTSYIETIQPEFQKKAIGISLEVPDNSSGNILFDKKWLTHVFEKVLGNALKFTNSGSVVVRIYEKNEGRIQVCVTDTGVGISATKLQTIFQSFKQSERYLHRSFEGVGLGLTLVKTILEKQQATISATSTKGEGATFTLLFLAK